MTDPRPIWLLDVDGVINIDDGGGWGAVLADGTINAYGRGWPLRWVPEVVDRIRDIARSGRVEIRWCTTWCEHADRLERLWRFPALSRCWSDERNGTLSSVSKRRAADFVIESGRHLLWTDDEEAATLNHDRALCIVPNSRTGLTPVDMAVIEMWVDENGSAIER